MLKMFIGCKEVNKDGLILHMDVAPFLKDSRTYVPIRFVAEGLGYNVDWDELTKTVLIYGRRKYFDTMDDAAYDWAMHFNAMSIAIFKEMCGVIYKDDKGYYWGAVGVGKDKEVAYNSYEARQGVAVIHSHSGGKHSMTKSMSYADYSTAKKLKRPMYMVDSGGQLWVYNPNEDKPAQKFVREGCPCDARHMDITENSKKMNEYFAKGYHDLYEFDFGFKADYYNKLFMKGLHYLKERAE